MNMRKNHTFKSMKFVLFTGIVLLLISILLCNLPAFKVSAEAPSASVAGNPLISDLIVNDSKTAKSWKIMTNLQAGDSQYGDRNFTITSLPSAYAGVDWIQTAMDGKNYTGNVLATFKVNAEADVFVAFDTRVSSKPSWLADWQVTTDSIGNSDPTNGGIIFTPYKKHFAANSTVSLGPNGQSKTCANYMVLVKGSGK